MHRTFSITQHPTCRYAKFWPRHAWRPPPKPIHAKGFLFCSSRGGSQRSMSYFSGLGKEVGSMWEKLGDTAQMSPCVGAVVVRQTSGGSVLG